MDDGQLLRYSRHVLLSQIGVEGQERLLGAHALVIGAGGLGSPVSMYLASAGVGTLTLCDGDSVDLTNLQRQIVHRTSSIGMPKVLSACAVLSDLNPDVHVIPIADRVESDRLSELVGQSDVVIDASDNFPTRHAVNRAAFAVGRPLVSGAAIRFDGQVSVFDPRDSASPCYACLFPEQADADETRCAVMGVFAPLVGIIGTIQAAEAIKVLTGVGRSLAGRLLLLDALSMEWRSISVRRDPACPVCCTRGVPASSQAAD